MGKIRRNVRAYLMVLHVHLCINSCASKLPALAAMAMQKSAVKMANNGYNFAVSTA